MVKLGKTLKYLRQRIGISQRDMAKELDITYVHLSNLENNKSYPSPELMSDINDKWEIDLYVLAWCLNGDQDVLPVGVKPAMKKLTSAWNAFLERKLKSARSRRSNDQYVEAKTG